MPIRPDQMKLYPGGSIRSPEWLAIRERIRARAGDCCEECGIGNHSIGVRHRNGEFYVAMPGELGGRIKPQYVDGVYVSGKVIQIVCTVAHLDGKLSDHSNANLKLLCQRCHLRLDHKQHQTNAAITRHEKRGQPDLLGRE